jgi:hypothetical protein
MHHDSRGHFSGMLFCEFHAVEDAARAMYALTGSLVGTRVLKVEFRRSIAASRATLGRHLTPAHSQGAVVSNCPVRYALLQRCLGHDPVAAPAPEQSDDGASHEEHSSSPVRPPASDFSQHPLATRVYPTNAFALTNCIPMSQAQFQMAPGMGPTFVPQAFGTCWARPGQMPGPMPCFPPTGALSSSASSSSTPISSARTPVKPPGEAPLAMAMGGLSLGWGR